MPNGKGPVGCRWQLAAEAIHIFVVPSTIIAQGTMGPMSDLKVANPPEGSESKGNLLSRVNVLLLLVAIVLGECLMAYLLIPSESEAKGTLGLQANVQPASMEGPKDTPETHSSLGLDLVEIDLDSHSITVTDAATGSTWRVDFKLYGLTTKEDEQELMTLLPRVSKRLRERIDTVIRESDPNDLTEPGLGLIKRKISAKVNEALGKPLLRGVAINDFFFFEH